MLAEAIGNERLKRNIFVANKTLWRQRAFFEQIKHGGDSGGGCDLNRGPRQAVEKGMTWVAARKLLSKHNSLNLWMFGSK